MFPNLLQPELDLIGPPPADVGRRGLALGAAGGRATGVREGTEPAQERPLQSAGPAGHQRRHRPPQSAGEPPGRAGEDK